jgi:superfamily II DNA or RNA helicase
MVFVGGNRARAATELYAPYRLSHEIDFCVVRVLMARSRSLEATLNQAVPNQAAAIHGDKPRAERERIIARFRRGDVKVGCSPGSLSTATVSHSGHPENDLAAASGQA